MSQQKAAPDMLRQLLESRWSCRAFLPDPVPRDRIEQILAMAQRSASWCNAQPWQAIVTSGSGTERFRETLYAHAASLRGMEDDAPDLAFPTGYSGIYDVRRRETGKALYGAVGIARGDREAGRRQMLENFRLFGAPHVAVITAERELGIYGAIDCGAYVSNFMLAAQAGGIATIAQAAIAAHSGFVRAHFGIPDDRFIVCGISFGFADVAHPVNGFRTARASLADTVQFVD